jgi:hypothetical protein
MVLNSQIWDLLIDDANVKSYDISSSGCAAYVYWFRLVSYIHAQKA